MSTTMPHPGAAPPPLATQRPEIPSACPAAGASFAAGLVALRLCWFPGVNCILAATSLMLGAAALWRILRSRGAMSGIDEAISGIVLGVVVLGLSVFFLSVLIAAYRR